MRWAKELVDDWDKSASFSVDATPRRSTSSLAVMIGIRAQFALLTLCVLVIGYARLIGAPNLAAPPISSRPDVIVTFDGGRHACVVARSNETEGHAMSCDAVLAFVRDDLKLQSGSVYDVRAIPDVDEAEMHRVAASLNRAGYRFIEGPHVMFLTGPHADR
jgi:hypothetical protein